MVRAIEPERRRAERGAGVRLPVPFESEVQGDTLLEDLLERLPQDFEVPPSRRHPVEAGAVELAGREGAQLLEGLVRVPYPEVRVDDDERALDRSIQAPSDRPSPDAPA